MPEQSRMILFPGLGADARLYAQQRRALPGIETPDWLPPLPRESLSAYAKRWGELLRLNESPAILAGVSMGGMISLEMARHHGAKAVVLVASCRNPKATSIFLKLGERASRFAPSALLSAGRVLTPLFVGRGGSIPRQDRDLLIRMAREMDMGFIRWAARAIMEWEGCPELPATIPVHHIHGTNDWAIPLRDVRPAPAQIIPGGAHVLNLSHPADVNELLARVRTDVR